MTSSSQFTDDTVALLREKYNYIADRVLSCDTSSLQWCETRQGQKNLCDTTNEPHAYLHSNYDTERETASWLQDLGWESLKDSINVLCVYGIGVGYSYDQLKEWLQGAADRYLVYFEDDLRVVRRLLETERGKEMLASRQVMLVHLGANDGDVDDACEELAYYFVKLPVKVSALPHYDLTRNKRFQYIQMRLMHKTVYVNYGSDEFLKYGCTFYRNYYQNLQFLPDSYRAGGLFGKFEGVPAIIVGAGPSLNRNFDMLKKLDRRALIFAGGSAMNALTNRGLLPHFGATVDPNHEQWNRMSTQSGFTIPFFYKGRTYSRVLPSLFGPRIFLSGNVGYPVSAWIEEQLGVDDPVAREGHNVLHLCMELARMMGCSPIIFVGMDLAYTDLQLYASDVVTEAQVTEKELTEATNLNNNAFMRNDIYGKPVHTLWKWVAEANYTAKYAQQHSGITFLNATEGGLGVDGVDNMMLGDVAERYLKEEWDLRAWVESALEQARFSDLGVDDVREPLKELKGSLERCQSLCDDIAEAFSDLKQALMGEHVSRIQSVSESIEGLQLKLGGEVAQVQILGPVNHIRSILFERKSSEIEGDDQQTEQQQMAAYCDSNREEILSLKEAARLNLQLLEADAW